MPPKVGSEGTGPSKPWKFTFNVVYVASASEKSQKLKLTLEILSSDGSCPYGGTFTIMHVPRSGAAVPLYSVTLPQQPDADDRTMRNYQFVAQASVDLTLGKEFRVDWSTLTSDGSVVTRKPLVYPAENVHP